MRARRQGIRLWAVAMLALSGWCHAQTDKVTYVYTDPQGTPLAEADAQGNIVAQYDYTPYGISVPSLGSPPNGPGYTGHVNDPETGLVYMQARYYDPSSGQFLSPDPVAPTPGNVFDFSRYAYASNNPINHVDPDGQQDTMSIGWWTGNAIMAQQSPQQVQRLNEQNTAQAKAIIGAIAAFSASPAAAYLGRTATAVASTTLQTGSLTTGLLVNSESVLTSTAIVSEGVAAANGVPSPFSAEALVVRGGGAANQSAAKIDAAIGPSRTAGVTGFSAQCNGGTCLSELGSVLRNREVGVTTVGAIQAAGGDVVATPGLGSHVTVTGLTGEQASPLMMVQKNPNPQQN